MYSSSLDVNKTWTIITISCKTERSHTTQFTRSTASQASYSYAAKSSMSYGLPDSQSALLCVEICGTRYSWCIFCVCVEYHPNNTIIHNQVFVGEFAGTNFVNALWWYALSVWGNPACAQFLACCRHPHSRPTCMHMHAHHHHHRQPHTTSLRCCRNGGGNIICVCVCVWQWEQRRTRTQIHTHTHTPTLTKRVVCFAAINGCSSSKFSSVDAAADRTHINRL